MTVAGPERRFRDLYDAHRREVLAYCVRRVSATDAADACAETFLVAWRRLDDVPGPPRSLPYLYGIAGRVIANQRRSRHRRARLHDRLGALGVSPPADPALLVLQTEQDREVRAAIRTLDSKDQEILMLHAWEGLPHDTIAEIVGMTRAAVDQRIHRCLQRLSRVLRPVGDGEVAVAPPLAEGGGR